MKARNIISLILIIFLAYFLFQALNLVPGFGMANIEERTATHYINKDVNSKKEEIKFNESKNPESGSANMVTSVVVNYRSFDTLGEVTVLFIAATGIGAILFRKRKKEKTMMDEDGSLILVTGVKILFPLLLLLGTYIFVHGHLTPGGGFQGGAVIATAFLLMFLAKKNYKLDNSKFKLIEGIAGITFVGLGLIGLATKGYFLMNFLNNGVIGSSFSSGIIPIIYIAIGFKVGAELAGIISNLVEA